MMNFDSYRVLNNLKEVVEHLEHDYPLIQTLLDSNVPNFTVSVENDLKISYDCYRKKTIIIISDEKNVIIYIDNDGDFTIDNEESVCIDDMEDINCIFNPISWSY